MSNEEIYKQWTEFINDEKYKKYFKSEKTQIDKDDIIEQKRK